MKPSNSILPSIGLLIFFLSGCESPDAVSSNAQFFPLAVGNKWYYSTGADASSAVDEVWEITGTKRIDDINYYKLITYNFKSNYADTLYYRYGGDTLFYRQANYHEYIAADFSLHLNDSLYWSPGATVTQKTNDAITFSAPFGGDYGYTTTYAKGVGITYSYQNGFIFYIHKLVKAEIK